MYCVNWSTLIDSIVATLPSIEVLVAKVAAKVSNESIEAFCATSTDSEVETLASIEVLVA